MSGDLEILLTGMTLTSHRELSAEITESWRLFRSGARRMPMKSRSAHGSTKSGRVFTYASGKDEQNIHVLDRIDDLSRLGAS